MQLAAAAHPLDIALELANTAGNATAVRFELGFSGAASADSAAQPGERCALPGETRQEILQLRELDLKPALCSARAPGKNIKNQLRPVDHLSIEGPFEIALLGWREIVIDDHHIRVGGFRQVFNFAYLPLAEESGGIAVRTNLKQLADDLRAGAA
jgi:hypothetical protein